MSRAASIISSLHFYITTSLVPGPFALRLSPSAFLLPHPSGGGPQTAVLFRRVNELRGSDPDALKNLVLARGYLAKLLDNKQVVRYLKQRQPEVLVEFETIVQTVSLE